MGPPLAVLAAVSTVLNAAGSIGGLFKGGPDTPAPPSMPKLAKLVPPGPPPLPTGQQLLKKRPGTLGQAPPFLSFAGLSPIQQRSGIATGALFGSSMFRDPLATDYYRNLALTELVNPAGQLAPYENILPVERQYAESLYGPLRGDSTEAFFDALLRGTT